MKHPYNDVKYTFEPKVYRIFRTFRSKLVLNYIVYVYSRNWNLKLNFAFVMVTKKSQCSV